MKTIVKYTLSVVFAIINCYLYGQKWQWAYNGGPSTSGTQTGWYLDKLTNGNVVCFGGFGGSIQLDKVYTSTFQGSYFLTEFDANGIALKTMIIRQQSQTSEMAPMNMKIDALDNIYIMGDIKNGIYFDTTLVNLGNNGYIVSLSSDHAFRFGKIVSDIVYDMDFDKTDNIFVCGDVKSAVSQIDTFLLYNPNGSMNPKMFLAKLDTQGKPIWVKQSWGGKRNGLRNLCLSGSSLYSYGFIDSCVTFDKDYECGKASVIYKSEIIPTIEVQSSLITEPKNHGWISSISSDGFGNCFAVGGFDSLLSFGGKSFVKQLGSLYNGFLVKTDSTQDILWGKTVYSKSNVIIDKVHTNKMGYSYVAGHFSGDITIDNYSVVAKSQTDMFIARFDPLGNCLGIVNVSNATFKSITQDNLGNAIVTGYIASGVTDFDNIKLTSNGSKDFFIAKLSTITGVASNLSKDDFALKIFANPNSGQFSIELPDDLAQQNTATLEIYNQIGALVKKEEVDFENSVINVALGEIASGIYSVLISSNTQTYNGKLVVK